MFHFQLGSVGVFTGTLLGAEGEREQLTLSCSVAQMLVHAQQSSVLGLLRKAPRRHETHDPLGRGVVIYQNKITGNVILNGHRDGGQRLGFWRTKRSVIPDLSWDAQENAV